MHSSNDRNTIHDTYKVIGWNNGQYYSRRDTVFKFRTNLFPDDGEKGAVFEGLVHRVWVGECR